MKIEKIAAGFYKVRFDSGEYAYVEKFIGKREAGAWKRGWAWWYGRKKFHYNDGFSTMKEALSNLRERKNADPSSTLADYYGEG